LPITPVPTNAIFMRGVRGQGGMLASGHAGKG
jgi:hypothetical protein